MSPKPITWAIIRILTMKGNHHLKELRANCARANDLSREFLMNLVRDNRDTEYGKKHHFDQIHSIEDYKRLVPLSDFDTYAPYIERMVEKGEKNLITVYPVVQYAETSGSVGVPKKIPVSDRSMNIYTKYTITRVTALAEEYHLRHFHQKLPIGRGFNQLEIVDRTLPDGTPLGNISGSAAKSYKALVDTNEIDHGVLYIQQMQTHALWRDVRVQKGTSLNQVKPVRVLDTPKKKNFFYALREE